MLSIWVRYLSGKEDVLFLVVGYDERGRIRLGQDDFGRYVEAVKIVSEWSGPFDCILESDDRHDDDAAAGDTLGMTFSSARPLIRLTRLSKAISCSRRPIITPNDIFFDDFGNTSLY